MATDPATIQQDAYDQLKSAVLGSGLNLPDVNKYYAPETNLFNTQTASAAPNYNTDVADVNRKRAEEEAKANQIDALKAQAQAIQDQNDPSKYQQVPTKDGGYKFYDPSGKEISAFDYARVTGQSPDKVLSQSLNPIDIGFTQDYKQLQDYLNAKANSKNDANSAQVAKNIEDIVKKNQGVNLAKMNINDVIDRFKQAYPTVFGLHNRGVPVGQYFIPSKNSVSGLGGGGL